MSRRGAVQPIELGTPQLRRQRVNVLTSLSTRTPRNHAKAVIPALLREMGVRNRRILGISRVSRKQRDPASNKVGRRRTSKAHIHEHTHMHTLHTHTHLELARLISTSGPLNRLCPLMHPCLSSLDQCLPFTLCARSPVISQKLSQTHSSPKSYLQTFHLNEISPLVEDLVCHGPSTLSVLGTQ